MLYEQTRGWWSSSEKIVQSKHLMNTGIYTSRYGANRNSLIKMWLWHVTFTPCLRGTCAQAQQQAVLHKLWVSFRYSRGQTKQNNSTLRKFPLDISQGHWCTNVGGKWTWHWHLKTLWTLGLTVLYGTLINPDLQSTSFIDNCHAQAPESSLKSACNAHMLI